MSASGNRQSGVVLYSDAQCIQSHRVRLVLAEKKIAAQVVSVAPGALPDEVLTLSEEATVPALLDRDLVLYDTAVITDYLDERYPFPPLMPVDPVPRARTRLALHRIEKTWYSARPDESADAKDRKAAALALGDSLTRSNELFKAMPYFLSDDFSVLDVILAPLLWRLPAYGIVLSKSAPAVHAYAQRLFERPGFQDSLSASEREMG